MVKDMETENNQTERSIFVGTSGFSYAAWRGIFYPEKLPQKSFLSYYSQHFTTTEVNNTFYRLPNPDVARNWYSEVGDGFQFTLKLSQRITHIKRLKDVESEMARFTESTVALSDKMGPILVQLPPNFRMNLPVLDDFLSKYAENRLLAVEFRHESWYNDEVYGLLAKHGAALGIIERDDPEAPAPPTIITSGFAYMRLRKGDYSAPELEHWAKWMVAQKVDVFCYLKHDDRAPVLATDLKNAILLETGAAAGSGETGEPGKSSEP
jgi:uncharacterized protein YecE (DUF72 family)